MYVRMGLVLVLALTAIACDGEPERTALPAEPLGDGSCVIWIHGRSDRGAAATVVDGRAEVSPDGNAVFGDGFEWRYGTPGELDEAAAIVEAALDAAGCDAAVLAGFSNGAAFVAALHCSGRTFDGRVTGVVVDDPVTDEAVVGCDPADGVPVAVYWTEALAGQSAPGTRCDDIGFTCSGDELIGIDAYAAALGVAPLASPFTEHRWHRDAPEIDEWLAG
jgi:pimeloyl-ACP methyl ester carboxylesterase